MTGSRVPPIHLSAVVMDSDWYRSFAIQLALGMVTAAFVGCGITRSTDTARTATEQLLISDAIDRAVENMNLKPLAGQSVFLDDSRVTDAVDRNYYISTLRQHLLAQGCTLKDKREDADFVVEARAGAIGTDRNDLLFGVPTSPVPAIPVISPMPSTLPEIPIAKRKDQRGVAKLALFAYHRATGTPVWQSGIVQQESTANDVWILGAGPFQHGTIYEDDALASTPSSGSSDNRQNTAQNHKMKIARESLFTSPQKLVQKPPAAPAADKATAVAATAAPPATPTAHPTPTASAPPVAPPAKTPPSTPIGNTAAANAPAPNAQATSPATTKKPAVSAASSALNKAVIATPNQPQAVNAAYAGLGISPAPSKPSLESAN